MNNTRTLRTLLRLALGLALTAAAARAQQPTPAPQKSADPKAQSAAARPADDEAVYTVVSSIELGYRGLRVGGDLNKYQSDLNYKAGPRLFDSSLLLKSKAGRGALLDTLLVTSSGWGADPNGHTRVSAENSDWFRFDGHYRRFKYFRYLNTLANPNYSTRPTDPATGQHSLDTRQRVGDFDLTLLPKNDRVRFHLGYSPARYDGPNFTTWHYGGDDFMLLSQARTRSNDFRVGADWKLAGVDFSLMQGFRRFRDDSFIDNQGVNLGVNPAATNFYLRSIRRTQPVSGDVDYTRLSAHTLVSGKLDLTGRLVYSDATTEFRWDETITGNNFNPRITGVAAAYNPTNANQTILTLGRWAFAGDSKRPNTLAEFGATYLATGRLRLSNTLRVETFQISGGGLYNGEFRITQAASGRVLDPLFRTGYSYELTKYRSVQNTFEGDYEFNPRYSARFGYRYGSRYLRRHVSGYNLANNGAPALAPEDSEEENQTDSFFGGVKARPARGLLVSLDIERGTSDRILTRSGALYDYWNVRARTRYAVNRSLRFDLAFLTKNNSNPTEILHDGTAVSLADFGVETKSRVFTSSADWTVNSNLALSGGYNYNWQDSTAVIGYTYTGLTGTIYGDSRYYVRNHYFHFDAVVRPVARLSFYASYRINRDTGQGERLSAPTAGLYISSYPMSFQSPEARLSLRLNRRLDLNLGYQYFNYNETELLRLGLSVRPQNYHAHQPQASLRFYFGGER